MATWTVRADYDPDARWWMVFDSNVPGLSPRAESLEALEAKLSGMILELLELDEHLLHDKSRLTGPHSFRLVANHETTLAIAA